MQRNLAGRSDLRNHQMQRATDWLRMMSDLDMAETVAAEIERRAKMRDVDVVAGIRLSHSVHQIFDQHSSGRASPNEASTTHGPTRPGTPEPGRVVSGRHYPPSAPRTSFSPIARVYAFLFGSRK